MTNQKKKYTLNALMLLKKEREQLSKEAIKQHEDEKPQKKESRKFKFTKKEDLL